MPCPQNSPCEDLHPQCLKCNFNTSCIYGEKMVTTCKVLMEVKCIGETEFKKELICRYCYQTEPWEHTCDLKANCNSIASPRVTYTTNCTVKSDVLCLGKFSL